MLELGRWGEERREMLDIRAFLAARQSFSLGALTWGHEVVLLLKIRLAGRLALDLGQALLGGVGLAGAGE